MIFVAAGTQDGREIVECLLAAGHRVLASVVSEYGKLLLAAKPGLRINEKPLDLAALRECLQLHEVTAFVDASHPYAVNVSKNAMAACTELAIPYIRYERSQTALPEYAALYRVPDYKAAAQLAASLGKTIFLTTGSRNLALLKKDPACAACRLIARVLPDPAVIEECRQMGFMPKDIIAMQGPFSQALNEELYKKYEADVVLTKNSGKIGGTDSKLAAAMKLGLPIVMIERPALDYPEMTAAYAEILAFAEKYKTS